MLALPGGTIKLSSCPFSTLFDTYGFEARDDGVEFEVNTCVAIPFAPLAADAAFEGVWG